MAQVHATTTLSRRQAPLHGVLGVLHRVVGVLHRVVPPPPCNRKLRTVATAVAATREPEARQTVEVWKALERAKLPRKVKEVARQVLLKKLPVGKWMESIGMGDTDKCPLCLRVEDNEHRVKQCSYLEVPIQLTRDLFLPIRDKQGRRIEPSRMCLEHQQKSLETEQGVLMWTAIAALWRYQCEVRYQRTQASREGYLGWWDGELRQ